MVILPCYPVPMDAYTTGDYISVTAADSTGDTVSSFSVTVDSTATTWDYQATDSEIVSSGTGYVSSQDEVIRLPEWPEMFILWEEPDSLPVDYKDSPRVVQHLAFTIWARAPPGSSGEVPE